jgi:hypothetical protein
MYLSYIDYVIFREYIRPIIYGSEIHQLKEIPLETSDIAILGGLKNNDLIQFFLRVNERLRHKGQITSLKMATWLAETCRRALYT